MKKFESLIYFKQLGLPICQCRKYNWTEAQKAMQFAEYLRNHSLGVGLRTELLNSNKTGENCPFVMNITDAQIKDIFITYRDGYSYIISECPRSGDMITQGTVYLLPDRRAIIYSNSIDMYSCRKAIENPSSIYNVEMRVRNWDSSMDDYMILRNMLVAASIRDDFIIGKRLEWSLFRTRGFIMWQMSEDEPFQNVIIDKSRIFKQVGAEAIIEYIPSKYIDEV